MNAHTRDGGSLLPRPARPADTMDVQSDPTLQSSTLLAKSCGSNVTRFMENLRKIVKMCMNPRSNRPP